MLANYVLLVMKLPLLPLDIACRIHELDKSLGLDVRSEDYLSSLNCMFLKNLTFVLLPQIHPFKFVPPFERLYLTTPDYKSLKVFGCAYFVLLHSYEYTKHEPYAFLCCFLGYRTEHKCYRCWDPISQCIHFFHHVIF